MDNKTRIRSLFSIFIQGTADHHFPRKFRGTLVCSLFVWFPSKYKLFLHLCIYFLLQLDNKNYRTNSLIVPWFLRISMGSTIAYDPGLVLPGETKRDVCVSFTHGIIIKICTHINYTSNIKKQRSKL